MKTVGQMVYLVHIAICLPHTDLLGKARGLWFPLSDIEKKTTEKQPFN